VDRRLHDEVVAGLAKRWSPQQIAGRLVEDHPADPRMRVSHETIYQTLFLQAKGELRTELKVCLRQGSAGQARPAHHRPPRETLHHPGNVINTRRTSGADH
jgi:IS30 family transposase